MTNSLPFRAILSFFFCPYCVFVWFFLFFFPFPGRQVWATTSLTCGSLVDWIKEQLVSLLAARMLPILHGNGWHLFLKNLLQVFTCLTFVLVFCLLPVCCCTVPTFCSFTFFLNQNLLWSFLSVSPFLSPVSDLTWCNRYHDLSDQTKCHCPYRVIGNIKYRGKNWQARQHSQGFISAFL